MKSHQVVQMASTIPNEKASLEPLKSLVEKELLEVNDLISKTVESSVDLIPLAARNLMSAGGKRLRPMLTLAAAKLCGYREGPRVIPLAASIEFIHAATLLHDDVIDDSALRRGIPTAKATWGNQASILVGDFLFVKAFQLMLQDGSPKILDLLASASGRIVEGEILQLTTQGDLETTQEKHLDVVIRKTSPLFEAAMGVGALVAESPPSHVEKLMSYGRFLGVCFQLVDDILDYSSLSATTGKNQGDDFRDAKVTLPVVIAYRAGTLEEKAFWTRTFVDQQQKEGDFQQALAYLHKHNALSQTLEIAQSYSVSARKCLDDFSEAPEYPVFKEILQFCLDRSL